MTARFFVDTNVLVYAEDKSAGDKRIRARELLRRGFRESSGTLSLQVLREFYVVALRKLDLQAEAARRRVALYSRLDLVRLDLPDLLASIDLTRLHSFSLWDALILRAAMNAGCEILYSEDLQHGFGLRGLEIRNPFVDVEETGDDSPT